MKTRRQAAMELLPLYNSMETKNNRIMEKFIVLKKNRRLLPNCGKNIFKQR